MSRPMDYRFGYEEGDLIGHPPGTEIAGILTSDGTIAKISISRRLELTCPPSLVHG